MTDAKRQLMERTDVAILIVTIALLISSIWSWIVALPIPRETVFLATTIALIISLILVLNVTVLIVLRLQRRVSVLEESLRHSEPAAGAPEESEIVVITLSNTERRVVNSLEEAGGKMTQDELRRATGLSKSTLSTTIAALERKALVHREAVGRTKIVSLVRRVTR